MSEDTQNNKTTKERIKEITDGIEQGIMELFSSDKYKSFLRTMSRFHKYSVNNTLLIHAQNPEATLVAGYEKWSKSFSRHVKKGEKGIKIIAPAPFKKKTDEIKLDPDTKMPVMDKDGKVVLEEKEVTVPYFKITTVFDVSQTYGKPLPQLASTLSGDVEHYDAFVEAIRRSSPVPVEFKQMDESTDGYFSLETQNIKIREGMSQIQTIAAMIHEISHSKLHNTQKKIPENSMLYQEVEIMDRPALFSNGRINDENVPDCMFRYELRGSDEDPGVPVTVENSVVVNHAGTLLTLTPLNIPEQGAITLDDDNSLNFTGGNITAEQFMNEHGKDRRTEEVEAESIAYAVCQYYGIETSENSFGYIASWSEGKELKELKASLEIINKASSALISDIDRYFEEICREQGIIEQRDNTVQETALNERLYSVDDNKYLHVQSCDDGFDYTIYDMNTKELIDGGQINIEVEQVSQAALEICKLHEIGQNAPIRVVDINILDKLRDMSNTMQPLLPDPLVTTEVMHNYGYTAGDMFPLSKDRALELSKEDIAVFMLYPNETEAMAFETEEIMNHDGLFGITAEDWNRIKDNVPVRDVEARFKDNRDDSMAIFQLKESTSPVLKFTPLNQLKENPDKSNYEAVYTEPLNTYKHDGNELENVFLKFNEDRPADFTGHSLSVSDIVALKHDGVVTYHYCDSVGFKELEGFGLKSAERNNQEKKESVLAKLKTIQTAKTTTAHRKSVEMEI